MNNEFTELEQAAIIELYGSMEKFYDTRRKMELTEWFDNYQLAVSQFNREARIQEYPTATVTAELAKIDDTKTLPDLISFSHNIINLEIQACLYYKELTEIQSRLANY